MLFVDCLVVCFGLSCCYSSFVVMLLFYLITLWGCDLGLIVVIVVLDCFV